MNDKKITSPARKTWTTHDAATARVTIEAPRNKVGDTQIHLGVQWTFDGEQWVRAAKQ